MCNTVLQSQTAVTAYFTSKQLLLFDFGPHNAYLTHVT